MKDDRIKLLMDKFDDYRRFSFVLLSLSTFMFLGLIIPSEQKELTEVPLIMMSLLLLSLAFVCHKIAMNVRGKLEDEQDL